MKKPDILYKYTTAETAFKILNNSSLRWSSPIKFNDILEFKNTPKFEPSIYKAYNLYIEYIINFVIDNKDIENYDFNKETKILIKCLFLLKKEILLQIRISKHTKLKDTVTKGIIDNLDKNISEEESDMLKKILIESIPQESPLTEESILKQIKDYYKKWDINKARVLCLTDSPENEVMWGTYCDNHYGCVLGFKSNIKDSCFNEVKKIKYTNNHIIGNGLELLLYGDSAIANKSNDIVYYTKNEKWSYEDEWRLLTFRFEEKENFGDYKFYSEELESITFGIRTTIEDRNKIISVLNKKYNKFKIFEIKEENGKFQRTLVNH
tara:strand:- start:861 stop:1829 length:969 start_codon:yes stop_codon:yes gene_type:complete